MANPRNKFLTTQKTIPLVLVNFNKWNPNVQNERLFGKLKDSIKTNGFTCPILVRQIKDEYEIIDGEHRYKACKELGYDSIKVEDMGVIEDSMAKMLTIALNNIRGQDDVLKRAQILKQLNDGQLALLPWDKKEIENELELANFDWSQYDKEEEIEEKKDYSICFALTGSEHAIVKYALSLTKKSNEQALLELVKDYMELRVDMSKHKDI